MDTQALHSYARRIAALLDDIDAIKEDIKVVEAEARTVCNCNVKVLRKWITAERKDKIAAVIFEIGDLTEYGQILGHMESFQGVRGGDPSDTLEAVEETPPHDPETGEIIEIDRPGAPTAPVAEPESPDAESADAKAAPNVNAGPAAASPAATSPANQDAAAPSRHDRTMPAVPLTPEENARLELHKFLDRRGAAAE